MGSSKGGEPAYRTRSTDAAWLKDGVAADAASVFEALRDMAADHAEGARRGVRMNSPDPLDDEVK